MSISRGMDKEDVVYVCVYIYIYIYIYNGYYSAIKRNEIISFAVTWMDLEIVILSEVSKDRERQISYDIT